MDFRDSAEETDFRTRLRAWLQDNNPHLPPSSTSDEYWEKQPDWHRSLYRAKQGQVFNTVQIAKVFLFRIAEIRKYSLAELFKELKSEPWISLFGVVYNILDNFIAFSFFAQ